MKDKGPIQLSPALSRIFRRHFDGDYYLPHVDGFIRANINKEDSINAIKVRYHKYFAERTIALAGDREGLGNNHAWRLRMHELIVDLKALSHTDFDVLRRMKTGESMDRDIKTIDGCDIIYAPIESERIANIRQTRYAEEFLEAQAEMKSMQEIDENI
jgi:hypothetical protein